MNGTGVGFSVEPIFVEQLPTMAERFVQTSSTVVVEDSREGWARALREVIALLYTGHVSLRACFSSGLGSLCSSVPHLGCIPVHCYNLSVQGGFECEFQCDVFLV